MVQGRDSTVPVTLEQMVYHTECVARGNQGSMIIADVPFMGAATLERTLEAATALMQAGANVIKLEGGAWLADAVKVLKRNGIPVCAHLGLTPQAVNAFGGYRVQGKDEHGARELLEAACELDRAGTALFVLECVPRTLSAEITAAVAAPVIGIGAAPECDGQVLVMHDMLGLNPRPARFVKDFMPDGGGDVAGAFRAYHRAVQDGHFPPTNTASDHGTTARRRRSTRARGAMAPRGSYHRAGAHHGQPPRRPSESGARSAAPLRPGGGIDLRQPHPVRPRRGLRRLSAHPGRGRRPAPRGRRGSAVRAHRGGHVPARRQPHLGGRGCPGRLPVRRRPPGPFRGVATVVSKLFNIVQPDVAVFGEKDFQQLAILRRMAAELLFPIRLIGAPTAREADGLAMSSRNGFLTETERARAPLLQQHLQDARRAVEQGERDYRALEKRIAVSLAEHGFDVDYVTVANATTLAPAAAEDRELVIAAAARLGRPRLIDNLTLSLPAA